MFVPGNRGRHEDRVEFTFDYLSKGTQSVIVREVKATVAVTAHHQELSPLGQYVCSKGQLREFKTSITDRMRLSSFERQTKVFRVHLRI